MNDAGETYGLHPDFETLVLLFAATSRRFWATIGHQLEADLFANPLAKPILGVVQMICKTAQHPGSLVVVMQRLQAKVHEGKLHQDTFNACIDLWEHALTFGQVDADVVTNELLPVVKHRLHQKAILAAHDDFAKRGPMTTSRSLLDMAQRLGTTEQHDAYDLGLGSFQHIASAGSAQRLPTGIDQLDLALDGGMERRSLGLVIANQGGAKSMALIHGAGASMRLGLFSGIVTLELSARMQMCRLLANLTGVDATLIQHNAQYRQEAEQRFAAIQHMLGSCAIVEMAANATSVPQIIEWVEEEEQKRGQKMDAVYIDYADLLYEPSVRAGDEYLAMRYVYTALRRDLAIARDKWVWTASQAKAVDKSVKRLDTQHASDSRHKGNIADLVFTNNHDEASQTLTLFVAKNRGGRSRYEVGPLPTDFGGGRLVMLPTELGAWRRCP